jgi:uncharacterized protein (TIGR03118 family)
MSRLFPRKTAFISLLLSALLLSCLWGGSALSSDITDAMEPALLGGGITPPMDKCLGRCEQPMCLQGFEEVDLVSNLPIARFLDPDLVNPWGFVFTPMGNIWTADNGTGLSTAYKKNGEILPPRIIIPAPDGGTGTPTGMALNCTWHFQIKPFFPAKFLWATEDGTIVAWNPCVSRSTGIIVADKSKCGAVYKGIALGHNENGHFIFATDFRNAHIDVFDSKFQKVGSFTDPDKKLVCGNFAPFGIRNFNGLLYVTYAKQELPEKEDDVAGPGNGFVDVFNTRGQLLRRLISDGPLNSPWGLEIYPPCKKRPYPVLAVGNFGDGRINLFALPKGTFLGPLKDSACKPIEIDGLWGIRLKCVHGVDQKGKEKELRLYFTAGLNDEGDGLLGYLVQREKCNK